MANIEKAKSEAEFRHHTSIGPNGELLFDCPVEIRDQEDLNNYNISWKDCRTLSFNGSEKVTVFFMKVESRPLAEYMWACLDSQHSRGYANTRCMIRGKRKLWVRCPDTVSCAKCPHKDEKQPPVISWDALVETGYETIGNTSPEEDTMAKAEYRSIKAVMDTEDPRISKALEMKVLLGFSVKEIAVELSISEPRTYQLLARAKAIGKEYRQRNS